MSNRVRTLSLVAVVALALVGGTLAARWLLPQLGLLEHFDRPVAAEPRPNHIVARLQNGQQLVMPYESPTPSPPPAAADPCEGEPLLPPAGRNDGLYRLTRTGGEPQPQASAYLAVAREAARTGRTRDSEVALLMACRLAARDAASDSVLAAADARQRLGVLYLAKLRANPEGEAAESVRARAHGLLTESHALFERALGADSQRTRVAASRVSELEAAVP